jgi:hypothetical protein
MCVTHTGEPASQLLKILRSKTEYLRISLASGTRPRAITSDLPSPQDKNFLIIPVVLQLGSRLKSSKATYGLEKLLKVFRVAAAV